ncbi:ATP-binding protein [Geodermatophilus sp. URMC 64]
MAEELIALQPDRRQDGGLPTGTVTFLFTDIAGSTRLVREDREAYAAALEDHRRLLRAAFATHGGREVDTQGDAFFVAFPTAAQAVAAAADAQRSLTGPISVRMGLHTGEATVSGGGYVGLDVHRAARIAAAASGGQILLSGTTAALAAEQMPAGTGLRSLGEHRLKDFPQPAALYQLDVDGLPTDFPPPKTLAPEHRLPAPPGQLLGRDDDLAALTALLRDPRTRLVTVTGAGGVGKTRLALEASRTVAADFPGGVVFVPLSAIRDPALVLPTVVDAVGARRERGMQSADAIRAALGDDRTLLVLDNFEQVAAAATDLAALLDAVPAVVALVTSRQVLRLRAEQQYPLATLEQASAIRLFAERAGAVRPGFTLDAASAAAVTEICHRLDGLPLAIELAAARVRLMPPTALLTRLTERLDVLAGGPVDAPDRQRTLRATMDWSYGLLGPPEQGVFARLAVFSGGWTLDVAEAVCGRPGEPDVLDCLSALLDASLLTRSGDTRLDMLETVRAYAVEKLADSPDREETERRHTRWMVDMVEGLLAATGHEHRAWADRLDAELPNLRAALQRAIETGDLATAALILRDTVAYRTRRDDELELRDWLDRALRRADGAAPEVRGRLLVLRALIGGIFGDVDAVRSMLPEGRALLPDDAAHANDLALAAVAGIYYAIAENKLDDAERSIEDALARFTTLHHEVGQAHMQIASGDVALLHHDLEGAQRHYAAAADLAAGIGDDAMVGQARSLRGLALAAHGDIEAARGSILDGVAACRRAGQIASTAHALEGLAALALADGRPEVAARALGASGAVRAYVGTPLSAALPLLLDDLTARAREQLGDEAYEAASTEGRQWPLSEALARTLEDLAPTNRPATSR